MIRASGTDVIMQAEGSPFKNNRDFRKRTACLTTENHVDEDYAAISENDLYCSAIDTFERPVWETCSDGFKVSRNPTRGTENIMREFCRSITSS